jgi:pullulanase
VAFLHSGAELLRSKKGIANSYNLPDSINQIDWSRKTKYNEAFNYYKQLIWLRRAHPAFRMPSTQMIATHLKFMETADACLIAYQITGNANGDSWKNIMVVLNGNQSSRKVNLPPGNWTLVGDENTINQKGIKKGLSDELTIPATAAYILHN